MKIIDRELLKEFRQKPACEVCGVPGGGDLEPHHVFSRGHGGGNRLDHSYNLIALCGAFKNDCHGKAQRGDVTRTEILRIVARRQGMSPDEVLAQLYAMMRAEKGSKR